MVVFKFCNIVYVCVIYNLSISNLKWNFSEDNSRIFLSGNFEKPFKEILEVSDGLYRIFPHISRGLYQVLQTPQGGCGVYKGAGYITHFLHVIVFQYIVFKTCR